MTDKQSDEDLIRSAVANARATLEAGGYSGERQQAAIILLLDSIRSEMYEMNDHLDTIRKAS